MESGGTDLENELIDNSNVSLLPDTTIRSKKYCNFPITIEPIVFFVFFADAFAESVTSNFILLRTCENHFLYNHSLCSDLGNSGMNKSDIEEKIQPYSALIITSMNFMGAFLPAIISLFAGPWSDSNGRKPLILISAIGYFLKYMVMIVLSYFPSLGPEYVLLAVLPLSLCGGIINFISASFSYISDISTENNRFFRISVIEATLGFGICFGLVLLTNTFKPNLPNCYAVIYAICAATVFVSIVYSYFFLPESLQNMESGRGLQNVFDLKHFEDMIDICFRKTIGVKRLLMFLSMSVLTISITTGAGNSNVLYLFTRLQFGWTIKEYTFWASVTLPIFFLGIFLGILIFSKWLKLPEALLGLLGCTSHAVVYFFIAFIPPDKPYLMYYSCLLNLFGGILGPMCRVLLSKAAPKEDLGKVFALTGSSESIFPLIAGPLYTALYNSTLNTLPSAFLLLTASLYLVCCIIFAIIYYGQKKYKEVELEPVDSVSSNSSVSPAQDIG